MRYAILSDIHGNLEALDAVLADIQQQSIDRTCCLGDIVGYYPNPNECVGRIQSHVDLCVVGNHDYAALGKIDFRELFTYYACVAMEWTQFHLSQASRDYLSGLPLTESIGDEILLTHSSPDAPEKWEYLFMERDELVANAFGSFRQHICFNAHTHAPIIMMLQGDQIMLYRDWQVKTNPKRQYLVNVGSVGQPRDFDHRASYAIYDSDKREISLQRVIYDFAATQKKVADAGLPKFLALRLAEGR